jgi:hypothetical protein
MKRDDQGFLRPAGDIDPAVDATLSAGHQRQANAHLSKRERDRRERQRIKAQNAKPRRLELLIDPETKAWLVEQSSDLGCTTSSLVEFAIRFLQDQIENGEVDLQQFSEPSKSAIRVRLIYPRK